MVWLLVPDGKKFLIHLFILIEHDGRTDRHRTNRPHDGIGRADAKTRDVYLVLVLVLEYMIV